MRPAVDIVIVNWKSSTALERCLWSISQSDQRDFEISRIVVVDNASNDGCAAVTARFPEVQLLENSYNAGFAAASNQGAAAGDAPYCVFLNPDTGLDPGALAKVVSFMSDPANAHIGICGIKLRDEQGHTGICCAHFPTLRSLLAEMSGLDKILPSLFRSPQLEPEELTESREVDQVIGAFFAIRRPLFEALHGFDERFFVYFEEVDLSLRARKMGARSYFLSTAGAVHAGRVSSDQNKSLRLLYYVRSRFLYCRKHMGRVSSWVVLLAGCTVEPAARLCWAAFGRSQSSVSQTFKTYSDLYSILWSSLSSLWHERFQQ